MAGLGEGDEDEEAEGLRDAEGEREADGETLAEGLTEALGLTDADPEDYPGEGTGSVVVEKKSTVRVRAVSGEANSWCAPE